MKARLTFPLFTIKLLQNYVRGGLVIDHKRPSRVQGLVRDEDNTRALEKTETPMTSDEKELALVTNLRTKRSLGWGPDCDEGNKVYRWDLTNCDNTCPSMDTCSSGTDELPTMMGDTSSHFNYLELAQNIMAVYGPLLQSFGGPTGGAITTAFSIIGGVIGIFPSTDTSADQSEFTRKLQDFERRMVTFVEYKVSSEIYNSNVETAQEELRNYIKNIKYDIESFQNESVDPNRHLQDAQDFCQQAIVYVNGRLDQSTTLPVSPVKAYVRDLTSICGLVLGLLNENNVYSQGVLEEDAKVLYAMIENAASYGIPMAIEERLAQVAPLNIQEQGEEKECDDATRDTYISDNGCWNLGWRNRGFCVCDSCSLLGLGCTEEDWYSCRGGSRFGWSKPNLQEEATRCYNQYKADLYELENKKYALLFREYYQTKLLGIHVPPGANATLRTHHGKYLSGRWDLEGGYELETVDDTGVSTNFELLDLDNGQYAIKNIGVGRYLRSDPGSDEYQLSDNVHRERGSFCIVRVPGGQYALRDAHGTYMSARDDGSIKRQSLLAPMELFHIALTVPPTDIPTAFPTDLPATLPTTPPTTLPTLGVTSSLSGNPSQDLSVAQPPPVDVPSSIPSSSAPLVAGAACSTLNFLIPWFLL